MKRTLAAAGVVGLLTAAALGAAQAGSQAAESGHYYSGASGLECTKFVSDDGNGGKLSAEMYSGEWRSDVEHFRGAYAKTVISAQELDYAGDWVTVKRLKAKTGVPVVSHVSDGYAWSDFYYRKGTDSSPRFGINVLGQDDLFRMVVTTKVFSDEGARLATLSDTLGNCRL